MHINNFTQSQLKQDRALKSSIQSFRSGQIVHGRVTKLFPQQTAEVQIGNQKVIAKLATPLEANQTYWLQVQPGEGKVHLKVVTMDGGSALKETTNSFLGLLKQLQLPTPKENVELLKFFMKEQLPITKELLQSASALVKGTTNNGQALEAMKEMILKDLPMTKSVLFATMEGAKQEPLQSQLQQFKALLAEQPLSNTGSRLFSFINELTLTEKEKVSRQMVTQLLTTWLNGGANEKSQQALTILQKFAVIGQSEEQSPLTSLSNEMKASLYRSVKNESTNQFDQLSTYKLLTLLNGERNKGAELQVYDKFLSLKEQLLHGVTGQRNEGAANALPAEIPQLTRQETTMIATILKDVQAEMVKWENSHAFTDHLRQLVKSIGLNYERDFSQLLKGENALEKGEENSLKSLLLKIIAENPAPPLKEAAEQLLNKITSIQLLSHESGPIQQFVMQVPLSFWNKTTDLTIQWSGKKKENGEIDPDYCRVLFYLDLEYLNEVIVDMQNQNRILNVAIYNDTDGIQAAASPFLERLKDNLAQLDYQLSSLQFHRTKEREMEETQKIMKHHFEPSSYTGVDIRI